MLVGTCEITVGHGFAAASLSGISAGGSAVRDPIETATHVVSQLWDRGVSCSCGCCGMAWRGNAMGNDGTHLGNSGPTGESNAIFRAFRLF